MKKTRTAYLLLVTLIALMAGNDAWAQRFSVASFKALPNDVSAFINPVRDLNDEDCGLIKVIASADFAFSTPLGVVKREDKTGEIWLYVPHGTKKITLKHPEWGVLRDYTFPCRIDSHMTYELRIDEPMVAIDLPGTAPVITTVRDTLVLTRVDTLIVRPEKKRVPFVFGSLVTAGYGGKAANATAGIMLMALKRHGAFVHLSTGFGKIGSTKGECDKNGRIGANMPFYSGRSRKSAFMVNAGAVHRLSGHVAVFEGLGYGTSSLAWELAPSEGGGYVKNTHYSTSGLSFELGAVYRHRRLALSASVISIKGTDWFGAIGVGITLGK